MSDDQGIRHTPTPHTARVARVAICVVTYERPRELRRLLEHLGQLAFSEAAPDLAIHVVDNDPRHSARDVCRRLPTQFPWPVHYVEEPRPGIAIARNRALEQVEDACDYAAFIDDDEVPEAEWLDELLRAQRDSGSEVVTGPVVPRYVEGAPDWVVKGRFHEQIRFTNGELLSHAYTNNVLLSIGILKRMDHLFDERLALSGGEDKEFFLRVRHAGFSIVWADQAVVFEDIPASRTTGRWILQRAFRYGNANTIIQRNQQASLATRCLQFVTGCYRIVKGCVLLPVSPVFGRHAVMRCVRHVAYGAGILAGFSGKLYAEYGRPDAADDRGAP